MMAVGAFVGWVLGGFAASLATASISLPLVGLVAAVTAVGGLVFFWRVASEIEFLRRGFRIRRANRRPFFPWALGTHRCLYEERGPDGRIQSLPFVRIIRASGYPVPSELRFPDEDWDAQVPAWARGRRDQIVERAITDTGGPACARVSSGS